MQTIEARVQVGPDHKLLMQLPADVSAGEYEVVLVLSQCAEATTESESKSIEKIQALLKQVVGPSYSLADELIQERREEASRE